MRTVRNTYEDYREAAGQTRTLKHWDDLTDAERHAFHYVAMSVAQEGIDAFCGEIELQARLATDRQLAAIKADPRFKISERRRG